jgi:predicted metal-dependent HD superfamily phosphohydrolase
MAATKQDLDRNLDILAGRQPRSRELTLDGSLKILSGKEKLRQKQLADNRVKILPPEMKRVQVKDLDARWRALCGRILPYQGGRLTQLEEQLLVLSGEIEGTDWKAASAASAALETNWIALLLKLHSDSQRVVRGTLAQLATMHSLFDAFGGDIFSNKLLYKASTTVGGLQTPKITEKDLAELVIWFMHAVRDPEGGQSEEKSADLLKRFCNEVNIPRQVSRRAVLLILQSKPFTVLQDASEGARALLDWKRFDIGKSRKEYYEYAHKLRIEYQRLPHQKYLKRRSGLLEDILSTKPLYLSDKSFGGEENRGVMERRARRNLKYELGTLRKGHLPGEVEVLEKAGGPVRSLQQQSSFSFQQGHIMTPLFLNVGTNYSLTHCTLAPGARTDRHMLRTTTKMYFMINGSAQLFRGGCCDTINDNDTCLVPANVEQYLYNLSNKDPISYLVIHQPPWREQDEIKYDW